MRFNNEEIKQVGLVEHRFANAVFLSQISSPHERLECASIFLSLLIDRAIQDLKSGDLSLRGDAYFWLTSSASDLYQCIAPKFGIDLAPSRFRGEVLAAGLPDFPDNGIPYMSLDSDDQTSWAYSPPRESPQTFRSRLARLLTNSGTVATEIESAVLNGVQLKFEGDKSMVLESAIKIYLACVVANKHSKTIRMAIEGGMAIQSLYKGGVEASR